jgi:nucleotide-binding universal stress UspA family protein
MEEKALIALVDGSAYSESVCHYAAWIAGKTKSKVKVYHVMRSQEEQDKQDLSGTIRLGARSNLLHQLSELDAQKNKLGQEHGRAILEDAQKIISPTGKIDVETRLRQGDVVDTIRAREDNADIILIGKRGEGRGNDNAHLGSNFESIVRATLKPIFVANETYQVINSIIVAFNGDKTSSRVVEYIAHSPLFKGMTVDLVYAGARVPKIEKNAQSAIEALNDNGLSAQFFIKNGRPENVLYDMTQRKEGQILVMGGYSHTWLKNRLIGSSTTNIIQSCKVPIFIVK